MTTNIVVAAPSSLLRHGEPPTPADLACHACIVQSDDAELTRAAVKSGLGVA